MSFLFNELRQVESVCDAECTSLSQQLGERQRLRQLKEWARKQSKAERQLEKELIRHEREINLQREKQGRLEEQRRLKEGCLRKLQQQQFSAKFHPACLVALVADPANGAVLSVRKPHSVRKTKSFYSEEKYPSFPINWNIFRVAIIPKEMDFFHKVTYS